MKKMLILTLTTTLLLLSTTFSAQALDAKSALSEDANAIINNTSKNLNLNLTTEKKLEFYDKFFKSYVEKDGWNMKPINFTTSLSASKIKGKGTTQFVDYALSYKERTIFMTLINFSKEKQILATVREVIPVPTADVLGYYEKLNKSEKHEKVYDKSNYSLFGEKGKVSYTNYHVNGSNAAVIYSYAMSFDY
jgi:hypothetical protein